MKPSDGMGRRGESRESGRDVKQRERGCFCEFAGLEFLSFHNHESNAGDRLGLGIKRNLGVNLAGQTAAYPLI